MSESDLKTDLGSVVGLVPAAGRAHRIAPLPCSKEIFPIGFRRDEAGQIRTQVVSHHLFRKFARAGASRAYVILRNGKWDIPAYFGDGQVVGVDIAYLVTAETIGPPDTLDRAYPFVANESVVFGFPDILFGPDDVFERLLATLRESGADVVLGLYPAPDCRLMDMVAIDQDGRVQSMALKPQTSELRHAWVCAAWAPVFTEFMHHFVKGERDRGSSGQAAYQSIDPQGDLPMGAVIKAGFERGLRIYGLVFPDDSYLDIGVPDHLVEAVRSAAVPSWT